MGKVNLEISGIENVPNRHALKTVASLFDFFSKQKAAEGIVYAEYDEEGDYLVIGTKITKSPLVAIGAETRPESSAPMLLVRLFQKSLSYYIYKDYVETRRSLGMGKDQKIVVKNLPDEIWRDVKRTTDILEIFIRKVDELGIYSDVDFNIYGARVDEGGCSLISTCAGLVEPIRITI